VLRLLRGEGDRAAEGHEGAGGAGVGFHYRGDAETALACGVP
jgi:hypothetical protein